MIGYHAFSRTVPGGFIGVDVFFVISGYLITTIILESLANDRFSYVDFYIRRIRRIFPALIVVLSTTFVAGWFYLFPDQYRQLGTQIAGGAAFVANLVLRDQAGYFDSNADTKPLLHLWSLGIEEQFYIFWPLILGFLVRHTFRKSVATWTIVVIAVASFAFNCMTMSLHPLTAFYSPFSRFWELMIGGLLAQSLRVHPAWFERFREYRSAAGVVLIGLALVLFESGVPYPGWRALLPTIGAFLIISAGPEAWINDKVLSHPVAVWFGKISYPLYLWHWPILVFATINQNAKPGRVTRIGLVLLSVLLAWLTYRLLETPVRRARSRWFLPGALFSGLAVVAIVGLVIFQSGGFIHRFGERGEYTAYFDESKPELRYSTAHNLRVLQREECNFYDFEAWRLGQATDEPRVIDASCYTRRPGTTKAVLLWGDSHAQHLAPGLRTAMPDNVALLQIATSGCGAKILEAHEAARTACDQSNQFALEFIRRDKPDVVVLAQHNDHSLGQFRTIATTLKEAGVKAVVVLGPVPQWKPDLNKVVARYFWNDTPDRLNAYLDPEIVETSDRLRAGLRANEPFTFVDLFSALCNESGCRTYLDGDKRLGLMTYDYGHLTPRASSFVVESILGPVVMRALGESP